MVAPPRWSNRILLEGGLAERRFDLEVEDRMVPGILWTPSGGRGPRPLVLAGHGFTLSKRALFPLTLARDIVSRYGFAVAVIDAPGHGDRQPDGGRDVVAVDKAWRAHWRQYGAVQIAAEWSAALDGLQRLPDVGDSPVGYWGLSLGTQYGVGFMAHEPRARAAVLGLFGLPAPGPRIASYAERVTCPVFFIQQADDEVHSQESVTALFDRLATQDKSLRASPGSHMSVPFGVFETAYDFLAARLQSSRSRP